MIALLILLTETPSLTCRAWWGRSLLVGCVDWQAQSRMSSRKPVTRQPVPAPTMPQVLIPRAGGEGLFTEATLGSGR